MKGILVLEDGSAFEGSPIGAEGERVGYVILNTAVVGYQEIMTDPANTGKIVTMTYPLIGNYGVATKFNESSTSWIEGLVIKEKSPIASNWQAEDTFDSFLAQEKITALDGVDTRTLAVTIRDKGELFGIISTGDSSKQELLKKLKDKKKAYKLDVIKKISVKKVTTLTPDTSAPHVVVLDLGILNSFINQMKSIDWKITLVPYNTDAKTILSLNPDGVLISSGPEEDESLPVAVETVQGLLGKVAILGISTGHQVICRALGGLLTKMKVGHHGVNYPVKSADSLKGFITVQNHSWVVDEDSLSSVKEVNVTLRNVNDKTVEEMLSKSMKILSIQYYPASPGNNEVNEVFKRFFDIMK